MKKLPILILFLFSTFVFANQYDYLLFSNNVQEVKRGLQRGANVNAMLRGNTPLYDAARRNNMQAVYLLINYRANVNTICHGETALHKVVQYGNLRIADALLRAGAKVNARDQIRGNTALHYAVAKNDINMIRLLVKEGADLNAPNNIGDTPAKYILSKIQIPSVKVDNKHLVIASTAFSVSNGAVGVSASNLTESFITITSVALYINGNLITESSVNKTIAPRSSQGLVSLTIPRETYQNIQLSRNGNASIQYGFAVEYLIDNSRKTLYKVTKNNTRAW
ncbi:ankyrin repeat domain-containing protein [Helicobacter anatolicus]|uniref:ankyrin repeat domain-containing protein n=1 Tax=Helicobacter anatolicus TaxID=2905874 RepID=UPI001E440D92|nr:ankyrin repeat domain-containing protein [Helicobacter anatolicus]